MLSRLLLESRAASALGLLLRPYTRLLGLHSPKAPEMCIRDSVRVVWGFAVTMATFSPTILFKRDDFPTLGPVSYTHLDVYKRQL